MAFRAMFKVGETQEQDDGTFLVELLPVPEPDEKKDRDRKEAFAATTKAEGAVAFSAKHPELARVLQASKDRLVYLDLSPVE